ncbi:class I adenylate-forming enzyme family protein [Phenylobacterium sp. LjRoot219]|uniref:class I adenylate-forming enzyme family protein n=1 Tax=Phenylobacterium sp. LjRoot219 TaxID=3342283 RepID=UPI003ECF9233
MVGNVPLQRRASIIHGPPLSEEPGLGALTLPGYLREVTERHATNEALVFHHADGRVERWSYAELWEQALAVARALVACGVGKDSRVGVMMTNRPEWLAAFFGVGLAGGVAATISTFSTPAELAVLLKASSVSVLLFEGQVLKRDFAAILEELEPRIPDAARGELTSTQFPYLKRLVVVGRDARGGLESWPDFLARGEAVDPATVRARADLVAPADAGALFFSSGSTGKPKGVLSSHRAVAIQAWRWRRIYGLQNEVRCWTANGFFWSGTFCMSLGATLSAGGSLVLQPSFDPVRAIELMEAERVTLPCAQPHQWAQLRDSLRWRNADLSSFRYVDPMFVDRQPTVATDWQDPVHSYGNTENFTIVAADPSGAPDAVAGASHGAPLPGTSIKIVDTMTGATLPIGERGEIAVKGPTLMLGYLGVSLDETLDANGYFRTGDGGFIDESGRLVFEGRLNDIIKTGGANVSPEEVDAVLETCPGVRISRTVGVPHETLGELVVSCVVPHAGAALDEDMVRDFAKLRLASYKAPRRVIFVGENELELTGSAKVKTRELREVAMKRLSSTGAGGGPRATQ